MESALGGRDVPSPGALVRDPPSRARNPSDVPGALPVRLDTALLSRVDLHGRRRWNSPAHCPRCGSHRHVFLLPDGQPVSLWELSHVGGPGGSDGAEGSRRAAEDAHAEAAGAATHEVYGTGDALLRSERRVHQALRATGRVPRGGRPGGAREVPVELLLSAGRPLGRRVEDEDGSADHARGLLRRTEYAGRPGEECPAPGRPGSRDPAGAAAAGPGPGPAGGRQVRTGGVRGPRARLPARRGAAAEPSEVERDLPGPAHSPARAPREVRFADRAVVRLVRNRGFGA